MSDGTSYGDQYADSYGFAAGLATAAGGSGAPVPGPGLATARGTALSPAIRRSPPLPQNLGGTLTVPGYGGTLTVPDYGGRLTVPNYGGGVTPVAFANASVTPAVYSASATSTASLYGGTLALADHSAALTGWTMQQVALTLAENNDESVAVAITQNGVALSLAGATVNMYLKTAAGTPDGSALLLSSAGGSPAITITNASGGLCTVAIPRADLYPETYAFYRIDVVFAGLQNTCAYGTITWITL